MEKRKRFLPFSLVVFFVTLAYVLFCIHRIKVQKGGLFSKFPSHGRLLCVILTIGKNHLEKAAHVNNTWGKRCDKLIFMSNSFHPHENLNTVDLSSKVRDGREWLWKKTIESLKYIYEHHLQDVDWILKADDDSFVVVENLRDFLSGFHWEDVHYFGGILQYWPGGEHLIYNTGGSGYILSRAALIRFNKEALPKYMESSKAREMQVNQGEDIELAMVLKKVGIQPEDTRDETGAYRFLQYAPDQMFKPRSKLRAHVLSWRDFWRKNGGVTSPKFVAFHYVEPKEMHLYEWIVHKTQNPNE